MWLHAARAVVHRAASMKECSKAFVLRERVQSSRQTSVFAAKVHGTNVVRGSSHTAATALFYVATGNIRNVL